MEGWSGRLPDGGVVDGYDVNPTRDLKVSLNFVSFNALQSMIDPPSTDYNADPFFIVSMRDATTPIFLEKYNGVSAYVPNTSGDTSISRTTGWIDVPDNILNLIHNDGVLIRVAAYDYEESESEYNITYTLTVSGMERTIWYNMTTGEYGFDETVPPNLVREFLEELFNRLGVDLTLYKDTYENVNGAFWQHLDIDGVSNDETGNWEETYFTFYLDVVAGRVLDSGAVKDIYPTLKVDNGDIQYDLANNPEIVADGWRYDGDYTNPTRTEDQDDAATSYPLDVDLRFGIRIQ